MKRMFLKLMLSVGLISAAAPMYAAPVYTLRLFNVDDVLTAYISNSTFTNSQFLQANFNTDTGFFDLSSLVRSGSNTINLSLYNDHGGWTYGYDFKKDGATVETDVCGVVTLTGCHNDRTIGQGVFTHAIVFSPDVATTGQTPEPSSIVLAGMGFLALSVFLRRKTCSIA